jgi:hypothetical protein
MGGALLAAAPAHSACFRRTKGAKCNGFKAHLATSPIPSSSSPLASLFLPFGLWSEDARHGLIGMDRVSSRAQNVCPDDSVG